jgi:hypothetical protein
MAKNIRLKVWLATSGELILMWRAESSLIPNKTGKLPPKPDYAM